MGVLNNSVGTIYRTVGEYYSIRCHTFPKNAVQQVTDMFKAKTYALEEMPGIFELYRIIQLELLQFDFHSHLDCQQTIGIPDSGYMGPRYIPGPYLKITDKLSMVIGYISITNR